MELISSIEVDDLRYRIIIIPQDSIFFLWMNLKIIIQLFINLYIFKTSRTSRRRNLRVFKNVYLLGSFESNQVFTFPGGNNNVFNILDTYEKMYLFLLYYQFKLCCCNEYFINNFYYKIIVL